MSTRITPTFLLKGIEINKLIADYQSGVFSRPISSDKSSSKKKIVISQNTAILAPRYGSSNKDPIFTIKDKHNSSVIFATTGHADYEIFTRSGGKLPIGGRCKRCQKDFDTVAMGYPVGYQELIVLTDDTIAHYRIIYVFWVEGKFCSFECTLGYIRMVLAQPADYRDPTLLDSERLLKNLFSLMYPAAGLLRPAQDPDLLHSNGGSLSKEQWSDERHIYIRTDRILMIPAKVEYLQQNFINPIHTIDYHEPLSL